MMSHIYKQASRANTLGCLLRCTVTFCKDESHSAYVVWCEGLPMQTATFVFIFINFECRTSIFGLKLM